MLKMSDIATHAGVSPTTVSFVLNARPEADRISEKTRHKVLQAAEELGYRSNQWARAMRTGNTKMLGLLGGRTAEEQVGIMLAGALEAADAQGYTLKILLLDSIGNTAQQVIRRSSELRLMGILALHLPDSILEELHTEASKSETPIVLMDARCENLEIPQVVSDDAGGIAAGVEHLIKLGHTKIAFIDGHGKQVIGLSTPRQEAFKAAMARNGLTIAPNHIQDGHFRIREMSVEAAHALLKPPPHERPTAIFCAGDLVALAAINVANELGLSVPHDVSIMGFANMTAAEFATPQLTTIEQPFKQMGQVAVNKLLGIISESGHSLGDNANLMPNSSVVKGNLQLLPTRLIERASTAPPLQYFTEGN